MYIKIKKKMKKKLKKGKRCFAKGATVSFDAPIFNNQEGGVNWF